MDDDVHREPGDADDDFNHPRAPPPAPNLSDSRLRTRIGEAREGGHLTTFRLGLPFGFGGWPSSRVSGNDIPIPFSRAMIASTA